MAAIQFNKVESNILNAQNKENASNLQRNLPISLQRSMEPSQEKGASIWLTALPIDEHGFALHKAFRDSLSLRYGWPLQNSPSHCSCGQPFSVEHALTCKTGGFPAVRHNEVRDITATLLTEQWRIQKGGSSTVLRAKRALIFRSHAHFGAKPRPFQSFLRQTTSPTSPIDRFSNEFSSEAF